jgi:uncharacterized membrane protein YraQ (UPF0718 family)
VSLHKQGANKGAVTSFLISTPESGVDSIAITYALLDPIMTVARPLVAFTTAFTAGIAENLRGAVRMPSSATSKPANSQDACRQTPVSPASGKQHRSIWKKLVQELRLAFTDYWGDLVGAFFIGILLAGVISAWIPETFLTNYLGGGMSAMVIMLVAGIPLYICATASTPIAAALILKGVSPGAALVFLLAGPATNMAAVAVVLRTLGTRSTIIYLVSIAGCALLFGVLVDAFYVAFDLSAQAVAGEAAETIPSWLALICAIALLTLSFNSLWQKFIRKVKPIVEPDTVAPPGISILPAPKTSDSPSEGPT